MNSPAERTGVLIVRLWIEANHQQGLRARITQTLDTMAAEESVALAASADDICAVIKGWVEDFAKSARPTGSGTGAGSPAGKTDHAHRTSPRVSQNLRSTASESNFKAPRGG